MNLERYDSYKDSEIAWLSEVPQHWEINKLKSSVKKIGDIDHYMPPTVAVGKPYIMTGDLCEQASLIDFINCKQVSEEEYIKLSKKIKPTTGDLIFARYATIGTVCYVDIEKDFLVSYSCVTIKPDNKKITGKYLFYFFKSNFFLQDIKSYINSNTQGNVGTDSLFRTNLILLPLNEQNKIVNYLDNKTQKIDQELSILEQKIEKYKELKQTLIAHTVLRGLDKNAELKSSEIEWIGDIPKHWDTDRLKNIFNERVGKNLDVKTGEAVTSNILSVMKDIGVINHKDKGNVGNKMSEDITNYKLVYPNDIVVNKMNVMIGSVGISKEFGALSVIYIILITKKDSYSKYYDYFFKMKAFQRSLRRIATGILEIREAVNMTLFMQEMMTKPPYEEQVAIANYLDEKTSKIDSIVEAIGKKIEALKEFRRTLINDVVTGKVKVA